MWDLCRLIWWVLVDLFRPRAKLEAEILVLRQQINILRRTAPKRLLLSSIDRLVLVGLYRLFPDVRGALAIVKPDTVIRWHRAGFRVYWRWKSRTRRGRPKVPPEIRQLIRDMSLANPLWGAPRIHGELLKLGIDVGQTSVAKYMARRRRPPSQGWTTFLRNHADGIVAMDLFVVPTISFGLLYGLLILRHDRRRILWLGATAHPTAEWIAHRAFPPASRRGQRPCRPCPGMTAGKLLKDNRGTRAALRSRRRREAVERGRVLHQDARADRFVRGPFGEQVEQDRVVGFVLLGRMRPVAGPHHALRRRLDVGACDRHRVRIGGRPDLGVLIGARQLDPGPSPVDELADRLE